MGEEAEAHGRVFQLVAQPLQGIIHNFLVVEGQRGQFGQRKPTCCAFVTPRLVLDGFVGHKGKIGNRNHPRARVAAHIAKGVKLFGVDAGDTCLFGQFAGGGCFQRFIRPNKAAGDGPHPLKRWRAPLDQQGAQIVLNQGEDDHIYSDGRPLVFRWHKPFRFCRQNTPRWTMGTRDWGRNYELRITKYK